MKLGQDNPSVPSINKIEEDNKLLYQ